MSVVKGRIRARTDWAPGLWSLVFEAQTLAHEPGQFLNLGLTLGGAPVRRAYSLASAPGAPLEIFLVRVADGALTPALYRLGPGDELDVDPRPHGFFTLAHVPDARDLWLVATGTGLGPYVAMLRHGAVFDRFERVVLVHGVRTPAELAYRSELMELEKARSGFRYLPAVSRAQAEGMLDGRVTACLAQGTLEAAANAELTPERAHVMLCGDQNMIEEMTQLLAARGMRKHRKREPGHITLERYW